MQIKYPISRFSVVVFFLAMGLLTGCTPGPPLTTDYDSSEDVTTYKTRSVALNGMNIGSGYAGGTSVEVRALASCGGIDCKPDEVTFIFYVSGSSDLRMEDRSVELTADGIDFQSSEGPSDTVMRYHELAQAIGDVASLSLSYGEFQRVAEAETVTGQLGSSDFSISYGSRSTFRALVQRIEGGPETAESEV